MNNPVGAATARRCIASLLAVALLVASCTDGDDPPAGNERTSETDDDLSQERPQAGGEIAYGLEAETTGGFCLPEAQLATAGIQVARTIFDTLTAPNAEGQIVPYLARSIEPSDDYSQWTIALRENITFHDGSPLDAQIVKDNLDAYRGQYPARTPLLFRFVFQNIASVEVIDPVTVKVTTTVPWVAFPWSLWSSGRTGIMARSQLDADGSDCANDLVGTGPFMLDHWTINQELVAERNPSYWQSDDHGTKLPYLDRITYRPIPDGSQRINALESGQIDVAHTGGAEEIAKRLRPLDQDGAINLLESDEFAEVNYIMLNSGQPPFDNKNARLAVAHALDRELLRDVRYGGIGTIANGPFREGVLGYTADTGFPEFDPDAARNAADAYENETGLPLEFTYTYTASESNSLTAQELQTQFAEAGITMALDPAGDQGTLINRSLAGDFEAAGMWRNHTGDDPDAQYMWWYEGSPANFGRVADAEINRLLDEGRSSPEGREEIYEALNRRFGSEVYNVWTTFATWAIAAQPSVQGIFGPDLPDGNGGPFPGLGMGHMVHGMRLTR